MAAPSADNLPGRPLSDDTVPPGQAWTGIVRKGHVLRIVDLEGQQAVDFLCYNADDPEERYNAADTVKFAGSIFLSEGTVIYSGLDNPMFTIVADSCGRHDTLAGCCSSESNLHRYGVHGTENCRDVFLDGLARHGLGRKDIVANINFFMRVPVGDDGSIAISDGVSKPGDLVDLRAEMGCLVVVSNCPQRHNPASGFRPTPVRIVVCESEAG